MRNRSEGRIDHRITAIGNMAYPAYVIRGDKKSLMIDAGVNYLGPRYLVSLEEVLGDPGRLDYLFLTHSHYDHLGAASYLKRHLPGLKVGGHERLVGLLQKPSVIEMMNRLSVNHGDLQRYNAGGEDLTLHPFALDVVLKEGDEVDLGGLTCGVYETPGHTRDSLAFYLPGIGALFPGDACGVKEGEPENSLRVEFVSSYQSYIDSLKRIIALRPQMLWLGHGWVLTGEDAAGFLEISLAETYRYRDLIESYLDAAGGDVERAIEEMAHDEYDVKGGIGQQRVSYVTNLAAQVKHIAGLR